MSDMASSRQVRVAQVVWLVVAIVGTITFAAGPILQWTALQTICHPTSTCLSFQIDAATARTLSTYGISPATYAVYTVVFLAGLWVLWYGLAALIIWRKPDDRGALLCAFFLVVLPGWADTQWVPSSYVSNQLSGVFIVILLLFALLFPDGRFVPSWSRWLAATIVVLIVTSSLPFSVPGPVEAVVGVAFILSFGGVFGAQIQRYRSVSSWAQRQQTKWGSLGLAVALLGILADWVLGGILPPPTGNGSLYTALGTTQIGLVLSAIPISIGIAVLRNQLWDIDRVINRALVYTSLSVTLVGIYIAGVLGLQALFRLVIGGSSTLAIALSTLAIAALFGPLRRYIQSGIDRRFYRSKYDAERILAVFGEQVRNQVDLMQLSEELTLVVRDALHPAHVSLWLAGAGREIRED